MRNLARNAAFRRLFAGHATSLFGDRALFVVLGIWTLDLTGSTGAGGLAFGFLAIGGLAAPVAGVIADRFPRRRVLIANDLAAAVLVCALLAVHDAGDVWIIYAVALGYGFAQQLGSAARGGLVAGLVADDLLPVANGLLESARSGIRIVAPVAGAALYLAGGGAVVALLDAATFLASAAFLTGLAVPDIAARGGRLRLGELAAGIRHLRDEPALRGPFPAIVIVSAGIGMAEVIPFAAVTDGLDRDSAFLGILSACHGAGAIVAGLAIPRLIAARGEIVAMSAAAAAGAVGMVLFALPWTLGVLAASTLFGACLAGAMVAWFTHLQRRTPDELRGRAMAAAEMLLTLPYVGSIAAGAALVEVVDFRLLSLAGAVALALGAVRIVYSRSRMIPIAS
jgi:MFS family permease